MPPVTKRWRPTGTRAASPTGKPVSGLIDLLAGFIPCATAIPPRTSSAAFRGLKPISRSRALSSTRVHQPLHHLDKTEPAPIWEPDHETDSGDCPFRGGAIRLHRRMEIQSQRTALEGSGGVPTL